MFGVTGNESPCIKKTEENYGNGDKAVMHNSPVHSVNPIYNRKLNSPRTDLTCRSPIQTYEISKTTLRRQFVSTPIRSSECMETLKLQGVSKTSCFQSQPFVETMSLHQEQVNTPLRTCSLVGETHKKNTFTVLPTHSSPPQLGCKVVLPNPFEVGLTDRLHLDFVSPSVFRTVVSPSKEANHFIWTIEDLASINPAPIEEAHIENPEHADDPEFEARIQRAIDRYFTKQHMVQSPWGVDSFLPPSVEPHVETPTGKPRVKEDKTTVGVQTMLSLPVFLPPALEEALQPYFSSVQTEADDLSTSTLRRKLFSHLDPPDWSPMVCSPVEVSRHHCSPPSTARCLSPLEISPISIQQRPAGNRSVTRLDFGGQQHMSVDGSLSPLGMAPLHTDSPDKMGFAPFSSHMSYENGTATHNLSSTNIAGPDMGSTNTTGYHTMGSTANTTTDESVLKPTWQTPWTQGARHFASSTPTKTPTEL